MCESVCLCLQITGCGPYVAACFFPAVDQDRIVSASRRADRQTGFSPRRENTSVSNDRLLTVRSPAPPPKKTPPSRPFRPAFVQAGRSFQEGFKRAADRRFYRPHTHAKQTDSRPLRRHAGGTVGQEDDHKLGFSRPSLIKTALIWALIPILVPGSAAKAAKRVFYPLLQVNEAARVTQLC